MLGQALAYAPNMRLAVLSGQHVLEILERKPLIEGTGLDAYSVRDSGKRGIDFEDVSFAFPARPKIPILRRLSLQIKAGSTVALVGPSGSGKSTTVQLLMRYYDPDSGYVVVDGKRTVEWERLEALRRDFGLVSQEPVLFDRTVAENIAYGDNARDVPMAEIISAAKNANIHEFVLNLPQVEERRRGRKDGRLNRVFATLSGLQHCDRGERRNVVRGPEAAHCDRQGVGAESAGADPGRGYVGAGQSERTRCAGCTGQGAQGTDLYHDCASSVDDPECGSDLRAGGRSGGGEGHARGADKAGTVVRQVT